MGARYALSSLRSGLIRHVIVSPFCSNASIVFDEACAMSSIPDEVIVESIYLIPLLKAEVSYFLLKSSVNIAPSIRNILFCIPPSIDCTLLTGDDNLTTTFIASPSFRNCMSRILAWAAALSSMGAWATAWGRVCSAAIVVSMGAVVATA